MANLEQDEFLKKDRLIRFGPGALLVSGILLCVLLWGAYGWRVTTSRVAVYEAAFTTVDAAAHTAGDHISQILGRLDQATEYLQLLSDAADPANGRDSHVAERFSRGLGLRGLSIDALGLTADGRVVAGTRALSKALNLGVVEHLGEQISRPRTQAAGYGNQNSLWPETISPFNGARVVPVVARLVETPHDSARTVRFIVYLVPCELLMHSTHEILGDRQGQMLLSVGGQTILRNSNANSEPAASSGNPVNVTSVKEALRARLDFDSPRLLSASYLQPLKAFEVSVSLRESDALAEFRGRVIATRNLAWGLGTLCMALVGMTAFALHRFGTKEGFLRRVATIDILTSLPNRRSFYELLDKAVARSERTQTGLGLVFLDLDNFKDINDSMGHPAGDALLQHVAKVLQGAVRPGDRVCRQGGDEFTIISPGLTTTDAALRLGERILDALNSATVLREHLVRPKASMGVALMPQHAQSTGQLVQFADVAMFQAKKQGKGCCVVYDDALAEAAQLRVQTAQDLAEGIGRNELFLVYQPKFCLRTGTLTGHEALVRWRHPTRGLVFPNDFITIAEESGLIAELGDWVLERAIRQIQEWIDEGKGSHKVAVNVSALQLRGADFVPRVASLLRQYHVPGALLQLELTESSLASDVPKAQALIKSLRELGASVAIDDFGTGYSSLGTLQSFEIDCLKVDRSFVITIHTEQGEAICCAVVSLARALGMYVVAEGVETAEQRDALMALGCDEVQGYLFSKPVAPEAAVAFAGQVHPHLAQAYPPALRVVSTPDVSAREGLSTASVAPKAATRGTA